MYFETPICCNEATSFLHSTCRLNLRRYLYPLEMSLKDKIETICKEMYGADGVDYSELAESRLAVGSPAASLILLVYCYVNNLLSEAHIIRTTLPNITFLYDDAFRLTQRQASALSLSAWRRRSTLSVPTPPRRYSSSYHPIRLHNRITFSLLHSLPLSLGCPNWFQSHGS